LGGNWNFSRGCDVASCNVAGTCIFDNGPAVPFGIAPSSQYAPDWPFYGEAADDFILRGADRPCDLHTLIWYVIHFNGQTGVYTVTPKDYSAIRVTIYHDTGLPNGLGKGPAGRPHPDGTHSGLVARELRVTPDRYSWTPYEKNEQEIPFAFEITMDLSGLGLTLSQNTKYWISIAPEWRFLGGYQTAWMTSQGANGNLAQQIFEKDGFVPQWSELFAIPGLPPFLDLAFRLEGDKRQPIPPIFADTDLTLLPANNDLRQDGDGPVTTKAKFDIFNENEVRFSGTQRCITCWDQTLLSDYDSPNHFLIENIHTDRGRARIDGGQSGECEFANRMSPLLGVVMRELTFPDAGRASMRSAVVPRGDGEESATIRYDIIAPPGEVVAPSFPAANPLSFSFESDEVESIEEVARGGLSEIRVASISKKGSLLVWPKVELRWGFPEDDSGRGNGLPLVQDTFLEIVNDFPDDVHVQLYFVNGDWPTEAIYAGDPQQLIERAHPGWNWVDAEIELTGDETAYWSVASGLPKGVQPLKVLDAGFPPGRPVEDGRRLGDRVLRGFVLGWAVSSRGGEINWNHLSGSATLVQYRDQTAWEYEAWAFACVSGADTGAACDAIPGQLMLNGAEYDSCPAKLLFDFYTVGSTALSHPDALGLR
jgi:hypothetical protein